MTVFKADSVELVNLPRDRHVYVAITDSSSPISIIIYKMVIVDETAIYIYMLAKLK